MNLVQVKSESLKEELFTTSLIIADNAGLKHRSVYELIEKHGHRFEKFGKIKLIDLKTINPNGGRSQKIYELNEQQAYLLFTYLRNSEKVLDFKDKLIKEFFRMRDDLLSRIITRKLGKSVHRTMTDAIKDSGENERMHGFAFSRYTDLVYKHILGMSAKKYMTANEIPKNQLRDYLKEEELKKIEQLEDMCKSLLNMGKQYSDIKQIITTL